SVVVGSPNQRAVNGRMQLDVFVTELRRQPVAVGPKAWCDAIEGITDAGTCAVEQSDLTGRGHGDTVAGGGDCDRVDRLRQVDDWDVRVIVEIPAFDCTVCAAKPRR